jgi:hypothetical protein
MFHTRIDILSLFGEMFTISLLFCNLDFGLSVSCVFPLKKLSAYEINYICTCVIYFVIDMLDKLI